MFLLAGGRVVYWYYHYRRALHRSRDADALPALILGRAADAVCCDALDRDLAHKAGRMRLISLRFGDVLASNGSVVPKFRP
jgi:polysaccharide biosynthesis protein